MIICEGEGDFQEGKKFSLQKKTKGDGVGTPFS